MSVPGSGRVAVERVPDLLVLEADEGVDALDRHGNGDRDLRRDHPLLEPAAPVVEGRLVTEVALVGEPSAGLDRAVVGAAEPDEDRVAVGPQLVGDVARVVAVPVGGDDVEVGVRLEEVDHAAFQDERVRRVGGQDDRGRQLRGKQEARARGGGEQQVRHLGGDARARLRWARTLHSHQRTNGAAVARVEGFPNRSSAFALPALREVWNLAGSR